MALATTYYRLFAAIVGETFLLTTYGVFVLKSLLLLRRSTTQQRSGYLLTVAILTMFALAIVLWTLDLVNFIMEAKITLIQNSEDPIDTKANKALAFIFRLEGAQDLLYAYMTLLGDAVIIDRIWKLQAFSGSLWVLSVPCAFLFGSVVATIMLTTCVAQLGPGNLQESFQNPLCNKVQSITFVMPCANTAVTTILIGVTTWKYRKSIAPLFRNNDSDVGSRKTKRTQCERILVLLLESGILYFLFFATQVIVATPPVHTWTESLPGLVFALKMYTYSTSVIVGMYPTILIVLANSKHNVLDRAAASSGMTSLPSIQIARWHTDADRTPTYPTGQPEIGTRQLDEIELDDLHALSLNDEEKGETHPKLRVAGPAAFPHG
ncbi:hypothetical protein MVEN_01681200 [Mycena venus]|uniref:Uncharacterized protein n=1 Tax=Mycena venus TaxID=2733690 RepID=A0A8H6XPC6_9AGAR|nr:hypothetical protein MVEN_01681200 [Mycena venus]